MTTSACVCRGKKHVPGPSGWVPCPHCYEATKMEQRLAALPPNMRDASLTQLSAMDKDPAFSLNKVVERLSNGELPKSEIVVVHGPNVDLAVAATIRECLLKGVSAERAALSEIVDSHFADDKARWRSLNSSNSLLLCVAVSTADVFTGATVPVLTTLLSERRWKGAFTILALSGPLEALRANPKAPRELLDLVDQKPPKTKVVFAPCQTSTI